MNEKNQVRSQVFISYSHRDTIYLNELKRHFKPLSNKIDFWDDSKILLGQKWQKEIENALNKASIAILLVSADFFCSDFIEKNELPPLLDRAEQNGTLIISVILKPCLFEEYPKLSKYQALNSINNPISAMNETEREAIWVKLVTQVKNSVNTDMYLI